MIPIFNKIIYLFIYLCLFSVFDLYGNIVSDSSRKNHTTFAIKVGSVFNTNGAEFFEIYKNTFGGLVNGFKSAPEIGLAVKVQVADTWRLALTADFTTTTFRDSYFQEFQDFGGKGYRYISQDFNFKQIPVLLNFEYSPYWRNQFRTFAGVGIGVNQSITIWNEYINSSISYDKRVSGQKYNDLNMLGAYRIYSAVDLGFDKKSLDHFLASLILQLSYTGFVGNIDIYKKVRNEFEIKQEVLEKTAMPISGYISLSLAISFNFNKKNKSPK